MSPSISHLTTNSSIKTLTLSIRHPLVILILPEFIMRKKGRFGEDKAATNGQKLSIRDRSVTVLFSYLIDGSMPNSGGDFLVK